jgi:hypothetical protein
MAFWASRFICEKDLWFSLKALLWLCFWFLFGGAVHFRVPEPIDTFGL